MLWEWFESEGGLVVCWIRLKFELFIGGLGWCWVVGGCVGGWGIGRVECYFSVINVVFNFEGFGIEIVEFGSEFLKIYDFVLWGNDWLCK